MGRQLALSGCEVILGFFFLGGRGVDQVISVERDGVKGLVVDDFCDGCFGGRQALDSVSLWGFCWLGRLFGDGDRDQGHAFCR